MIFLSRDEVGTAGQVFEPEALVLISPSRRASFPSKNDVEYLSC